MESLCITCSHVREVISGTGSKFLLCQLSQTDKRFSKYPPQPIARCDGHEEMTKPVPFFTLEVLAGATAICRLDADADIPGWANGEVVSITRTADELSIVCSEDNVPDGVRSETGWRCLRVAGPLDFSKVGVLASLTGTLAAANISVFVISTFDTDYVLVKNSALQETVESLGKAGHALRGM